MARVGLATVLVRRLAIAAQRGKRASGSKVCPFRDRLATRIAGGEVS
jgi:hypothetical protein